MPEHTDGGVPHPRADGEAGEPHERKPTAGTGSIRPALAFGFVMATVQMTLLLWLLYC